MPCACRSAPRRPESPRTDFAAPGRDVVARGASQDELFAAVTREIGWLVGSDPTSLMRFDPDDTVTLVAAWSARESAFPIGATSTLDEHLRSVRDTGQPWRWGPAGLPESGPCVAEARRLAIRSVVAVPILVDGQVWGTAFACSREARPLAEEAEERIANFTELVGIAISNINARAELAASGPGSQRPPTTSAGDSCATCTTGRSNGSSTRSSA